MYILGINAAYHESAACLIKDGKVVFAVEEERLNRIKHGKLSSPKSTHVLPWESIQMCLDRAGITMAECEHIGYSFNPSKLQQGMAEWSSKDDNEISWELSENSFQTQMGGLTFLDGILNAEREIRRKSEFKGKFHYLSHHACHASSAFHVSPFENSAVLVVDGIGEWASSTIYEGKANRLHKVYEDIFPNSIGFVWEKMSMYLGFDQYDASKVMGLAAYGHAAETLSAFRSLITDTNEFCVDFRTLRHESTDFSTIESLFSLPKRSEPLDIDSTDPYLQQYLDVAAGLQAITEETVFNLIKKHDLNKHENLCMAGGVALNCAMNGKIMQEQWFKNIYIQPAAHDAGTALGAAFLIWHEILAQPRSYVMENAYLGPDYDDHAIEAVLAESGLQYQKVDITKTVAKLISEGNIIGWFNGRMEWGPRALGNRSLLADPRNQEIREIMNVKVKHRELYRPFCPSVLAEKAADWFDADENIYANKFMLTTAQTLEEKKAAIPAVVHTDGSVRLQAVFASDNPQYYALLSEFESLTGVPVLLNTSFNDCEPIVCTPQDAINTFLKTDIDYLALGNYLVSK